jgi:hypothetical protein
MGLPKKNESIKINQAYYEEESWIQYCKTVAQPSYDYFNNKVMGHKCISIFTACRLANPSYIKERDLTASDIREVITPLVGKLFEESFIDDLIKELADYKMSAQEVNWDGFNIQERIKCAAIYWTKHKNLKAWTKFAHLCMLHQPSSACVERAFSYLKNIFESISTISKQDYIECSLKLMYNRRDYLNLENETSGDESTVIIE